MKFITTFVFSLSFGLVLMIPCIPSLYPARRIPAFDNKKISRSVIWKLDNLTKDQCVVDCYKESNCVSAHYSILETNCIALAEQFDGVVIPTQEASGYQLWQTSKPTLFPDCDVNEDCATKTNAHCFNGICRCDIGYGVDGATCRILSECVTFADMTTVYEGHVVWGHDIDSSEGQSLESCQQLCNNNPNCKSGDHDSATNRCWLADKTWFEMPSGRASGQSGWYYIQRDCNW